MGTQIASLVDAPVAAQRRSFAYGNTHIENDLITRELIEEVDREIAAKQASGTAKIDPLAATFNARPT